MHRIALLGACLFTLTLGGTNAMASQPQAPSAGSVKASTPRAPVAAPVRTPVHEFILVKIVPGKRTEALAFLKNEYYPIMMKDENILSLRNFIEDRADWSMIVETVYDDYSGMERSRQRFGELLAEKFPDPKDRAAFIDKFQSYVVDHSHMLFRELPDMKK